MTVLSCVCLNYQSTEPPVVDLEYQLLEASRSGDLDTVVKILSQRPDVVNCRDMEGRHSTPLHFASGTYENKTFYYKPLWFGPLNKHSSNINPQITILFCFNYSERN